MPATRDIETRLLLLLLLCVSKLAGTRRGAMAA
jgi:hypothetical protein